MTDKFTFGSAGEIQDLEFALARNGWTHTLLKKATGGDFFGLVREVVEGRAEICRVERLTSERGTTVTVAAQHIINCDAKPFEPSGLMVAPESEQLPGRVRGQFTLDPAKVELYLSEHQKNGKAIEGNKLYKELANEPVLPANVLDFYLANTHLIPERLKKVDNGNVRCIFFWGTIYRGPDGSLCVRCLYFSVGGWYSRYFRLDYHWFSGNPAALRAS